jgi:hypothetical protein
MGVVERGVLLCGSGIGASLAARFNGAERHRRRFAKVSAIRTNPTVVYGIPAVPIASQASDPNPKEQ